MAVTRGNGELHGADPDENPEVAIEATIEPSDCKETIYFF